MGLLMLVTRFIFLNAAIMKLILLLFLLKITPPFSMHTKYDHAIIHASNKTIPFPDFHISDNDF